MMLMSTYILWCVRALAAHALYAGARIIFFFWWYFRYGSNPAPSEEFLRLPSHLTELLNVADQSFTLLIIIVLYIIVLS
jgi:hypothetical protein